jgi:hypothetical protein
MMKQNFRKAFNALEKIGAPVFENEDGMFISGEDNCDEIWADYYDCMHWAHDGWLFGVNGKINKILDKYGLFAEWVNPGLLGVYEA